MNTHRFATLVTFTGRPAVCFALVTLATSKNIVPSFVSTSDGLRHNVVNGSVSSRLQRFRTVVTEFFFTFGKMSSLVSVGQGNSIPRLINPWDMVLSYIATST